MSKFSARVAVHGDEGTTWFDAGDEVPEWAAELVGDHCILRDAKEAPADEVPNFTGTDSSGSGEDSEKSSNEDDGSSDDEDGSGDDSDTDAGDDSDDEKSDTPDFTAPASPRRGRPRKNS